MDKGLYIQFGSGLSAPSSFINFDSSPTLRLQRNFLVGWLARKITQPIFPESTRYGDITRGLPVKPNSLKGVYCSHVLEHLALDDLRKALKASYLYLEPGGTFRCVLPDLYNVVSIYMRLKEKKDPEAANKLMRWTFLGYEHRPRTFIEILKWKLSGSHHFWMWDYEALASELEKVGFTKVQRSDFGLSTDPVFNEAEDKTRFEDALCIEAVK